MGKSILLGAALLPETLGGAKTPLPSPVWGGCRETSGKCSSTALPALLLQKQLHPRGSPQSAESTTTALPREAPGPPNCLCFFKKASLPSQVAFAPAEMDRNSVQELPWSEGRDPARQELCAIP